MIDPAIRKADEKIAAVLGDKEAFRAYQMREMALRGTECRVPAVRKLGTSGVVGG